MHPTFSMLRTLTLWLLLFCGLSSLVQAQSCNPFSLLPCEQVVKPLPYQLTFNGTEGGLKDKNNLSTGLLMALPHTRTRLDADLPVTYPAVNGYEPSRLVINTQNNGTLTLTTHKGIAYLNYTDASTGGRTNTQVNTLGTGFKVPAAPFTLETTLLNPVLKGKYAQQAGLWIGSDDNNFLKLVLTDKSDLVNTIQLRKEVAGKSGTADAVTSANIPISSLSQVKLKLVIDPAAKIATAYYKIGTDTEKQLGTLPLPDLYQQGISLGSKANILYAGIFATHRSAPAPISVTFGDFGITTAAATTQKLVFTPSTYQQTYPQGQIAEGFAVDLSSTPGTTTATLSAVDAATGTVPAWISDVNGKKLDGINNEKYNTGISDVPFLLNPSLAPGTYKATIKASSSGFTTATLQVTIEVTPVSDLFTANVNFQDQATPAPNGYFKDFGEPYALRKGTDQGNNTLAYGWINPSTKQPADLTRQGRNRSSTGISDPLLATLVHMDNPYATPSGYWEIAVPNGTYSVTVGVGDAATGNATEYHRINAEGVLLIENFIPFGAAGSTTRFSSNTKQVSVSDGKLTLDYAGGGANTKLTFARIRQVSGQPVGGSGPVVTQVTPRNGATNVPLTQSVTVDLDFPNQVSLDVATVNSQTVRLYEQTTSGPIQVSGTSVNATGGGDAITLSARLEERTAYLFEITEQVKDLSGASMVPFTSTFTTGSDVKVITDLSNIKFKEQILIDDDFGEDGFTGLTIGPDNRLYAVTSGGTIERWDIQGDGTLANHTTLRPFGAEKRLAIKLTFDPAATATNLVAWLSHTTHGFQQMPDWGGKISKLNLNDPNAVKVTDYVINLPRSYKDHVTNGIDFGPDRALYFTQGSSSGMGLADPAWGQRNEHLLTAAVLRLDVKAAEAKGLPLNAKTEEGGSYDPYAPGAPLTIYATGVRNAYDLVWHSNGELYVPTNGSAAGSNVPGLRQGTILSDGSVYQGSDIAPITNLRQTQEDFLFRINEGGYYGHPNPTRREYIMNGGNPTEDKDPAEVVDGTDPAKGYPVGTLPELRYQGFAYNFGVNKSPNGVIEYRSNAFGGKLKGKLMVCRFSGGDDVFIMEPGGAYKDIISVTAGDTYGTTAGKNGLRRPFANPLTLVEDTRTGNLYISEYFTGTEDGEPRITLLRPDVPATTLPVLSLSQQKILLTDKTTTGAGQAQALVLKNTGSTTLQISALSLQGADKSQFKILNNPVLPVSIIPGSSMTLNLSLEAASAGIKNATLSISSNASPATIPLRGIGHADDEPSFQYILDAHQIPVKAGDDNPATAVIHSTNYRQALLGDETAVPLFKKAGGSQVTLQVLGVFGPGGSSGITTSLGWYLGGNRSSIKSLFTVNNSDRTSLMVKPGGSLAFNPGTSAFGFYSQWPYFNNRLLFQEDSLNTFTAAIPHHVRVYPLKDAQGFDVPNAYIVTFEEHISGFDYQDIVLVVRNVAPIGGAKPKLAFSPLSIEKSVIQGQNATSQTVKLTTSGAQTTAQIVDPQVPWLTLSGTTLTTGSNLTLQFKTANLEPNHYYATIRATADGYEAARLDVVVTVAGGQTTSTMYVNFQNASTNPPPPYLADYGQPYGIRDGANQGSDMRYGWVVPGTSTPLDLQGNGRNRGPGSDVVKETMIHMQYQQALGASSTKGVLKEGAWEMVVPNGRYTVSITAGDTYRENTANTRHYINAEGINIVDFTPVTGTVGVRTQTAEIQVEDGKLTLDAQGGYNTKIIAAVITPRQPAALGPEIAMVVQGNSEQSGAYLNKAKVTLTATPQGSATTAKVVEYRINQETVKAYTGPFDIAREGIFTITATASDNNGNFTTKEFPPFQIKSTVLSNAGIALENMQKMPKTTVGVPYDDHYVFQFVITPRRSTNIYHTQNTIRIRNTGTGELIVSQLKLSAPGEFVFVNGDNNKLPLNIPAQGYYDLVLKYKGRPSDVIATDFRSLEIVSNAANNPNLTATLACGLMPLSEGNNELDAQQVLDLFGYKTDMRQTLSNGTKTVRPSSVYPSAERVNSGKEGDLILSKLFVQADLSRPVDAYQMAAFKGPGGATVKLADTVSGTTAVGGFSFRFGTDHHQSLLPKTDNINNRLTGASVAKIATPFVINSSDYTTLGKNFSGGNPTVLGVRIYKVFDRNGKIRPNEYVMIQDYVANGCGSGSANCDWNDIMVYFRNIRPKNEPFALAMPDLVVKPGATFSFNTAAYFDLGYAGNKLTYQAYVKATAANLPSWMKIDPATGVISGTAPAQNGYQLTLAVNATDLNGLDASGTLNFRVSSTATNARLADTSKTAADAPEALSESTRQVQVYPNPFREEISVVLPEAYGPVVTVRLVSVTGQVVSQKEIKAAEGSTEMRLEIGEAIKAGLYFLRVESPNQPPQLFRIMKE